ncbi:chaplin [Streptacidiphilus sp. P02-A3a]|uniref:chaplin n=1 Tax=Streptacidiphilus sp. P02-A3a TaxID=2704468 RepID=UPI0015F9F00A|nr:chaplin [Streptacidiphilus sp. P02-A3a]QMU69302.1 chaplin [Streptacidiphilus sp. P02-A3a]
MQVKKIVAVAAATGGLVLAGAGVASAHGAQAEGAAWNSPGVVSGNTIQVPVHIPVNVCGNTISVIGLLNPAFGNSCKNF